MSRGSAMWCSLGLLTRRLPALCVVLALSGCARYEYQIVEPTDLAVRIGKEPKALSVPPLEYRMQTYDNRLVVHVRNPTQDPIQLFGGESYVVDAQGQSHPLRTMTIAPGSFIKLIFPPRAPEVYPRGPVIGVGVGMHVLNGPYPYSYHRYYHYYPRHYYPAYYPWGWHYDPWYYDYGPYYLDVADYDPTYWEWTGETEMRVRLVYQRGNERFQHEFVIRRVKV